MLPKNFLSKTFNSVSTLTVLGVLLGSAFITGSAFAMEEERGEAELRSHTPASLVDLTTHSIVKNWSKPEAVEEAYAQLSGHPLPKELIVTLLKALPHSTCVGIYKKDTEKTLIHFLREALEETEVSMTTTEGVWIPFLREALEETENGWNASDETGILLSGSFQEMMEGPFTNFCFTQCTLFRLIDPSNNRALVKSPIKKMHLKNFNVYEDKTAEVIRKYFPNVLPDPQEPICQYLTHLKVEIGLRGGPTLAEAIAQTQAFQNLIYLNLDKAGIGDVGTEILSLSPFLQKLTHLNLSSNKIGIDGAKALTGSQNFQNLIYLDLHCNRLGVEGVKTIAQSGSFPDLTHLNLSEMDMGDEGAKVFAESQTLQNLVHLDLCENEIGIEGMRALAGSPLFQKLVRLKLSYNFIGDSGAELLAQSPCFQQLIYLELRYNDIGDKGTQAIQAGLPHLKKFLF
ncbi:MAG TPA: hypothetical protein VMW10_03500 [Alphaproteobacteria bacterium]|nr:hypothetical protein [Alphaproteobacteria bacterium]